ncbi:MAG: endonuclease/exonuclease/phosphatase family protein [Anaerolineae bacterium]
MMKKLWWLALLILALVLAGCGQAEPSPVVPSPTAAASTQAPVAGVTPTTEPTAVTPSGVLLSQALPGVFGVNNNLEFVELYNAGSAAVDLDGWSLWYRLDDSKEEQPVYQWRGRADVPAYGHYLLAREGQDVGTLADATFDLPLFEKRGGLALRNAEGETVDAVVWGEGPESYLAATAPAADAAPVPEGGASLARAVEGGGWGLNPAPNPRNSGDAPETPPESGLALRLELPAVVGPGEEIDYRFEVRNDGDAAVQNLLVRLPLPAEFEVVDLPEGAVEADGWLEWTLPELAAGASQEGAARLRAPWTYLSELLRGAYVEAGGAGRAYAPLTTLAVEGGAIPIGTARGLEGQRVTVEGVATMYSGGFFAGSTGTKFYLEDESGGVQVYCPGGAGLVDVQIGDRVQVSGEIEIYRTAVELVPSDYDHDVVVLAEGGERPEPREVSLEESTEEEDLLGRLVRLEGTANRVEEFTYSYEVDLIDGGGSQLLVYVDKDAGLTAEPLEVGRDYRMTGILELYNGEPELLPRYQSDMAEVFPPELRLEASAPSSARPGETITYTLTVYNHTAEALAGVEVSAVPPAAGLGAVEPLDGGEWEAGAIVWRVGQLPGDGGSAVVRYTAAVDEAATGQIVAGAALATAQDWPQAAEAGPLRTFVGWGVPVWAIQGDGDRSSYVGETVATEGIVTGVFPDLEGFWIQSLPGDGDPATSDGVFILAGQNEVAVDLGDLVRLEGRVRERSGQTLLYLLAPEDLEVAESGLDLPEPVDLDPPADPDESHDYYEALEGMLVGVGEPAVVVGPTTQYGETALVRQEWDIEHVMRGDPTGMLIFVDDGSSATHVDASTLPFAAQVGDTLSGLVGPLAYTFEAYKIEPITPPVVTNLERARPTLAPAGPDEFAVATFNVENLFDTQDPHPSDPPMASREAYALDLHKTAGVIAEAGAPEIVGLQEVENVGVLEDLAAQESLAAFDYQPLLIEGGDSRGIDVGYLVRGDRATVEGVASRPGPDGLTSRHPLLITVTLHLETDDVTVYVLNNHFLSMSAGEAQTEPQRQAQAAWNATLLERILAAEPEAYVVVMGDLNSFYDSPPLDVLRAAGLRHVYEFLEPLRPYSYIYQGVAETLDHLLVTDGLYAHLARVDVLHVDADYSLPVPGDDSPGQVSDHDPVVAVFAFE